MGGSSGGKGGGAPSSPNPTQVGNEQIAVNQATLNQLALANHVNSNNPLLGGTSWSGTGTAADPFVQTTNYSPQTQAEITQQLANQQQGLNTYGAAEGNLASAVGAGNIGGAITNGIPINSGAGLNTGGIVSNANDQAGQGIQRSLAPSSMGDPAIAQAENAAYAGQTQYLDPQWSQAQDQLTSQLTGEGIAQGSTAWNNAMLTFNNQKQQAYQSAAQGAVGQGQAEQSTLFGQGAAAGQFANSAQNQNFSQDLANAGFTNTAQQQQFGEGATQAGIQNAAAQQNLNQTIAEQEAPINEVNALSSGAQVSNPSGGTMTGLTPSGAPNMLGANQLNYQGNLNSYNASVGQQNSLMGSLLSMGTAAPGSLLGGLGSGIASAVGGAGSITGSKATDAAMTALLA